MAETSPMVAGEPFRKAVLIAIGDDAVTYGFPEATSPRSIEAMLLVVAGQVTLDDQDGNTTNFGTALPVGTLLRFSPRRIRATTTAQFVLLYR